MHVMWPPNWWQRNWVTILIVTAMGFSLTETNLNFTVSHCIWILSIAKCPKCKFMSVNIEALKSLEQVCFFPYRVARYELPNKSVCEASSHFKKYLKCSKFVVDNQPYCLRDEAASFWNIFLPSCSQECPNWLKIGRNGHMYLQIGMQS